MPGEVEWASLSSAPFVCEIQRLPHCPFSLEVSSFVCSLSKETPDDNIGRSFACGLFCVVLL